jgi:hypothetical protein
MVSPTDGVECAPKLILGAYANIHCSTQKMAALLSLREKNEHFAQGRIVLVEFTPKFQMGFFFENSLKTAVCHFCAFHLSLQGFIILCF